MDKHLVQPVDNFSANLEENGGLKKILNVERIYTIPLTNLLHNASQRGRLEQCQV